MNKLILLCVLLFAVHSSAHRMVRNGHAFERDNWEKVKTLLETPSEKQIGIFVMLVNPAVVKQYEQYVQYVARGFDNTARIFSMAIDKHNLLPPNEQYYFVGVDISKAVMLYVQEKLNPVDNKTLKQWIRKHPVFLVMMTNCGEVHLMKNTDNLNNHLILSWVEKQSRIPLLKYAKQMTSFNDITISMMNMMIIVACLGFFVVGARQDNFRMRQLATVPICLFPAGHVYNQIHGNEHGERNWLGISFSRHYNGQCISESYFIFVIIVCLTFGLFNLIESMKAANRKLTAQLDGQFIGQGRGRMNRKLKASGDEGLLGSDTRQAVYFSQTIIALGLLYQSYLLKY